MPAPLLNSPTDLKTSLRAKGRRKHRVHITLSDEAHTRLCALTDENSYSSLSEVVELLILNCEVEEA